MAIKPKDFNEEMTAALYGETMISSVSRVEKYYSCPFAHYAAYGLKLEERAEYQLEAPQMGDLFHAALKWIADETKRLDLHMGTAFYESSAARLAKQAVDYNRASLCTPIIIKYKSLSIYSAKIRANCCIYALLHLASIPKYRAFVPIAIEAGFGPGEDITSIRNSSKA